MGIWGLGIVGAGSSINFVSGLEINKPAPTREWRIVGTGLSMMFLSRLDIDEPVPTRELGIAIPDS